MSASVINGDPEKLHKVYEWAGTNPLGTIEEFRKAYCIRENHIKVGGAYGRTQIFREWNIGMMREIPSLVEPLTYTVRKTDPGVSQFFKGLSFEPIAVEMDSGLFDLYEILREEGLEARNADESTIAHYNAMRLTCLHPSSHLFTSGKVSKELVEAGLDFSKYRNTKLERMMADIEVIAAEGDKMVVFTHWTNLSLNQIAAALGKAKISYVTHTGAMSERQRESAKLAFNKNPDVSVFLTSDAGSHGLNMQVARWVLNYDCPTSYDLLMQRCDRIDRADSHLDGLTARMYYYEGTLEERIWRINTFRRQMASAMQGTSEELHRPHPDNIHIGDEDTLSTSAMNWLIFGDR